MNRIVSSNLEGCRDTLDSWLSEKAGLTAFIGKEIEDRGYLDDKAACLQFLIDCSERDEQIYDSYIGFADATCIFAGGWEPAPGEYDPLTRDWYKDAAAAEGTIISDPYVDADTGRMVITCSVKLVKDGQVYGVLAQDLFIDQIQNVTSGLSIDQNGYPVLMTSNGTIIFHKLEEFCPGVDSGGNEIFSNITDAIQEYSQDTLYTEIFSTKDAGGEKIRYSEIDLNEIDWRLGYAMNAAEYNRDVKAIVIIFIILSVLSGFVISLCVALLIRNVFKPLMLVAENSRRIAEGNLNVAFSYDFDDEIGDVCGAIENNNRVVKHYIDDISTRLDAISKGNFARQSDVSYIGDYIPIKNALDKISQALSEVFDKIALASSAVFSGAEGVTDSSGRLSESVSSQSQLIEEIMSGMKTLSDKIENNVSRTDEARKSAQVAADKVNEGSSRMQRLMTAMKDISKSSEQIQNIIGTIENIAFQTNILALNASVEAARAGAAGKGFAVVADEVRNLAGKSAAASEETAHLIELSVAAVKNGTKLAAETSDSLSDVVTCTNEIDKIIVKINEESHEQSVCVDDVNGKISRVADYINTAASNSVESASAAEALNGQAADLNEMLDRFKS